MKKVNFYGDMIYAGGWFAYIRDDGKSAPLTRKDARKIELDFRAYNARMDVDRGGMEPKQAYESRGLIWNETTHAYEVKGSYWIDELAPSTQDIVIGDELIIPENVGGYKMNHIYKDSFQNLDIEKLVIPEEIIGISSGAFDGCTKLKDVQFGNRVDIESNAFGNCPFISFLSGICYINNTLYKATENINKNLVIPGNITSISDRAFENNKTLETVKLPEGCAYIGQKAFCGCVLLKSVTFTGKADLICASAFENCPQLERMDLPEGIWEVPENLFKNCSKLSEVTIPTSVTKVGKWAFLGTSMEKKFLSSSDECMYVGNWMIEIKKECGSELAIREGTVGIAERTHFDDGPKRSFKKVHLPDSVKYLNTCSLTHSELEDLDLGSVEDIGLDAIRGNKCKEIHIPATCKKITYWNFANCPNIEDIYFHNPKTFIEWPAITDRSDKFTIRIHGYAGSTAEEYCREYGEKFNLMFVAM